MFDDEEKRLTNKRKEAKEKSTTKAKLDSKISGYPPTPIDALDGMGHSLTILDCAINLRVGFLGPLYYGGTKETVSRAIKNPALDEAVARLIRNGKVPGIEVIYKSA